MFYRVFLNTAYLDLIYFIYQLPTYQVTLQGLGTRVQIYFSVLNYLSHC